MAVAVFALLGLWRGAARQIASLVALVCASIASRPLSEVVGPWLAQKQPELALSTAMLLGFAISFAFVSLTAYVLVFLSIRPRREEPQAQSLPFFRLSIFWDKSLGLFLGTLKGGLLVWLLLSVTTLLGQELNWLPFRLPWNLEESRVYAFVKKYNALNEEQWIKLLALEKLAELPPHAAQLLPMGNPSQLPKPLAQELEKLQKLFEKLEPGKALDKKQLKTLLKDKELDQLMTNDSFLKALEEFRNFSKITMPPAKPPADKNN